MTKGGNILDTTQKVKKIQVAEEKSVPVVASKSVGRVTEDEEFQ